MPVLPDRADGTPSRSRSSSWRNVVALGWVSLLNDAGSDMVRPLLPLFLTVTLGASPLWLGLVEGIAEAIQATLKWVAGAASDRMRARKGLVLAGYGISALVRPVLSWVTGPVGVLAVRGLDRVGKGIRSAPRDALIAASVPPGREGAAFGLHRSMDHAGAVIGPLLAAAAMAATGDDVRMVFLLAGIPGVLAVLAVAFGVTERVVPPSPLAPPAGVPPPAAPDPTAEPPSPEGHRRFAGLLGVLAVFTVFNATDVFLVLRARELGVAAAALPVLWAVLNVSRMTTSLAGGLLADHLGKVPAIVVGWTVNALAWGGLAVADAPWQAWALTLLYGAHAGLAEPGERALVKSLVRASGWGRAYGALGFVQGGGALVAGILVGALWAAGLGTVAMGMSAAGSVLASVALAAWWRSAAAASPRA